MLLHYDQNKLTDIFEEKKSDFVYVFRSRETRFIYWTKNMFCKTSQKLDISISKQVNYTIFSENRDKASYM